MTTKRLANWAMLSGIYTMLDKVGSSDVVFAGREDRFVLLQ